MGRYNLDYKEEIKELIIRLEGDWTYEETKDYQEALKRYVENKDILRVLIDQSMARFTPECMEIFIGNHEIKELKETVTAAVYGDELYPVMNEMMKKLSPEERKKVPNPFADLKKAQMYLISQAERRY